MPRITTLYDFVEYLEKSIPININDVCDLINEKSWFRLKHPPLTIFTKAFLKALDSLEKTPVIFQNDMKITQPQYKKFLTYFNAYETIKKKIQGSSNKEAHNLLKAIDLRILALKYRIESIHGGLDKQTKLDDDLMQRILKLVGDWKAKQKLYPKNAVALSERDIKKIQETCSYPLFTELLISDSSLQNQYFNWAIRDNNNPGLFIEFPATYNRLYQSLLDKRVGRIAPHALNIIMESIPGTHGHQKNICLPFFNGTNVFNISILDEAKQVTLNNNYTLTIKEIFAIFSNKKNEPGNLEFFGKNGIMNWNSFELGAWNPRTKWYDRIHFRDANWWKQLPVLEELSKKQVEDKYKISLKDGDWVHCISSTRESLFYDVVNAHGYKEVAIPQPNGNYHIYPFGKFPKHYPTFPLLKLRMVTRTVEARIKYPDENIFYSRRQHARYAKALTPIEGMADMYMIKNDLLKSLSGNLSFQLGVENCAHWGQKDIPYTEDPDAPNPFKMTLDHMRPTIKEIEKVLDTGTIRQYLIIKGLQFFSSMDGKKFKENDRRVYKTAKFGSTTHSLLQYQPALLNNQIEDGALPGVITYGN